MKNASLYINTCTAICCYKMTRINIVINPRDLNVFVDCILFILLADRGGFSLKAPESNPVTSLNSFIPLPIFLFDICSSTHANLSLHAICRTCEKSFNLKGLFPQNILLSILCLCLGAPSLNNAVYVNSILQALITTA